LIRNFSLLMCLVPRILMFLIAMSISLSAGSKGKYLVYVGTYTDHGSQGIYAYRFDSIRGETTPIGLVAATENPTFLAIHPNRRLLYAVNEVDQFEGKPSGGVSAFAMDRSTGKLNLINSVSSMGKGPAHLSLDKTGKYVLVANYGGGSVAVFPIEHDGRLGKASAFAQHTGSSVNPDRQSGPHAHQILMSNDNRYALVADLGLDEILVYKFNAAKGSLTPNDPAYAKTDPEAGPRHLVFSPDSKFVYVINELQSSVKTFSYNPNTGKLRSLQTISTLPRDFRGQNTDAEIAIDAKGRFLYASSRGHDSIMIFAVDPKTGTLSHVQDVSTQGKTPRNFAIDPTGNWLFAANQDSNNIVLFKIDPKTGQLTPTQHALEISSPVCVTFAPAAD
jgi:6-phosphogluconolactonase